MKTGVKIQDESIKLLTTWAKEPPLMPDWTQKAQANMMEMISAMPQRYEEAMRMINEQSKSAMDLLHKGFEAGRSMNRRRGPGESPRVVGNDSWRLTHQHSFIAENAVGRHSKVGRTCRKHLRHLRGQVNRGPGPRTAES